jgi:imidazolonepropionase-like amidohydrolase
MSKQLSFVWLLLAPACLHGQSAILLRHANVIDGLSDRPIRDATVLVENGQIKSLGPGLEKPPSEATVIDLRGRWLLPGLIDAHVHLIPDDPLKLARAMVNAGVTTIRTMGASSHFADVDIRELHRQGAKDLPEVVAAGYQIRPDIAVAAETFLLDFPQLTGITRPKVSGPDNVRLLVQANVQHGVNLIKVLATERAGTPETDPRRPTFTEQEMIAIVDEARKSGLPVAAHAHGDEAAAVAVRAGVRSIEHGSFMTDSTLDLMKERGTYLVPTLAIMFIKRAPAQAARYAELTAAQHVMITHAWKKRIPIVAGTDTNGSIPLSDELAELVKIGLSPMDAIKSATSVAAECLGVSARTGSIRRGYEADLVVVDADPLVDVSALKKVVLVVNDGQIAMNKLGN